LAILLILFLTGDHIDGFQARRTKTSSALGEFIDHFLDAINNGVVIIIFYLHFYPLDQLVLYLALFTSYAAHSIIFFKQYKTGILRFDRISSFEGVLFISFLLAFGGFWPINGILGNAIGNFMIIEWLLIAFSLLTFVSAVLNFRSISFKAWDATWIVIGFLVMAHLMLYKGGVLSMLGFTLYCSQTIGRIIKAHLFTKYAPFTPLQLSLVIAAVTALFDWSLLPLLTYLLLLNYLHFSSVLRALINHWHWKNPSIENS
jgi:phosphatidylglycerophosphate synthase